jgi:hypothetical protein
VRAERAHRYGRRAALVAQMRAFCRHRAAGVLLRAAVARSQDRGHVIVVMSLTDLQCVPRADNDAAICVRVVGETARRCIALSGWLRVRHAAEHQRAATGDVVRTIELDGSVGRKCVSHAVVRCEGGVG